ncbi:MAG: inorganic phosphate transporter [Solirubrobacteraceae bacterium]
MDLGLIVAIAFATAFALTNGFHDAANAIATLVATRGATPGQAIALSSVFNLAGAVLLGTAVADTIGKIVELPPDDAVTAIGSGLAGATAWNLLTWWRGLPSSSGHALVGGLVGAAIAEGGVHAVNWGGFDGWHPVGVIGTLVVLLISPVIGFVVGFLLLRALRRGAQRWTRRWRQPLVGGEWVAAAALSYSHGANDAQKTMGVIAALLVAGGQLDTFSVPLWVKLLAGGAIVFGTALGGWRIIATMGRHIFGLKPLDSFASQTSSTAVILTASLVGGPVSTTQVVASSVVGTGAGRHRWRHVRWEVVRAMGIAWIITMPGAAVLAIAALAAWNGLASL